MLCGLQVTCTYVCKIINRQCISFSHPLPLSVALHLPCFFCNYRTKRSAKTLRVLCPLICHATFLTNTMTSKQKIHLNHSNFLDFSFLKF